MTQKSSQPPFFSTIDGVRANIGAGSVHFVGSPGSSAVANIGGPDWNTRYHFFCGVK